MIWEFFEKDAFLKTFVELSPLLKFLIFQVFFKNLLEKFYIGNR